MRGYTFQMARSSRPAVTAMGLNLPPVRWGSHHAEFARRFGNSTMIAAHGGPAGSAQPGRKLDRC